MNIIMYYIYVYRCVVHKHVLPSYAKYYMYSSRENMNCMEYVARFVLCYSNDFDGNIGQEAIVEIYAVEKISNL